MVERSLSMREVRGSIPRCSKDILLQLFFCHMDSGRDGDAMQTIDNRTHNSSTNPHVALTLERAEQHRRVVTAKPERVAQRHIHLKLLGLIRDNVEVDAILRIVVVDRGMHRPGRDALQTRHRLHRTRRTERVAQHALRAVQLKFRFIDCAENRVDGGDFAQVAHGGGCPVRVDEVHLRRLEARVGERAAHAQDDVTPVRPGRGEVVRVGGDAAAEVLA